jgi:nucleotide-binding universal stress UspA family protein
VLLPLDGTLDAEHALPYAVMLALRFKAELVLLQVVPPLPARYRLPKIAREMLEQVTTTQARQYLCQLALDVTLRQPLSIQVHVMQGHPHQEIVAFADSHAVDVIVMKTQRQNRLTRWLLGNVTEHVAKEARMPVLMVPAC